MLYLKAAADGMDCGLGVKDNTDSQTELILPLDCNDIAVHILCCYDLSFKPLAFLPNLMFAKFHHIGLSVHLGPCDTAERSCVKS